MEHKSKNILVTSIQTEEIDDKRMTNGYITCHSYGNEHAPSWRFNEGTSSVPKENEPYVNIHHCRVYPFRFIRDNTIYERNLALHPSVEKQLGIMGVDFLKQNDELYYENNKLWSRIEDLKNEIKSHNKMGFADRLVFLFKWFRR